MPDKLKELEQTTGRPAREVLIDLFSEEGTQTAVARRLGIHQSTLSLWLLRLGLEQRTILVERERAS
jgi:transposase-like protein